MLWTRRELERDIIGTLLVLGNCKTEPLLMPDDFQYKRLSGIFKMMLLISKDDGVFDPKDLLYGGDRGKYVLHLMDEASMVNLNVKCRHLVSL